MMIMICIKIKKLRKLQNAFIFNMAIADFFQALLIMPTAFVTIYFSKWVFGFKACQVFAVMKLTITLASVHSLAGISLQRYFFVVKRTYRLNTKKSAACGIIFVWSISLLLSITPFLNWGELGFEPGKEVCTVLFHKDLWHTLTIALFGLIINIIIMVTCYCLIFQKLRHFHLTHQLVATDSLSTTKNDKSSNEENTLDYSNVDCVSSVNAFSVDHSISKNEEYQAQNIYKYSFDKRHPRSIFTVKEWMTKKFRSQKNLLVGISTKELQLLKTISIVVVTFICCWAPYCVFNIVRTLKGVDNIDAVDTVTMWFGFLNSALNPLIYGVINSQFKRSMVDILRCRK